MTQLALRDFDAYFQELHGHEPFPWQRRLVQRILGVSRDQDGTPSGWPRVLALPTASGKTACLDVAVFTLACQANAEAEHRTAPRRIFFVVDRRVIVDEAHERALSIARELDEARSGVLARVAANLRKLSGAGEAEPPLVAFQLRGGIYRDDAWARTPLQPTIIASTVDQLGSRLLQRGYGVSRRSWPIHAGLAAHDSLILLDEAHCAQPFEETVEAVQRYRAWAEESLPAPFNFVSMTATPRQEVAAEHVFRLEDEDSGNAVLALRLEARKPVELIPPLPAKSGVPRLVQALADQAHAFARDGARRIALLVNRVDTARRLHDHLEEKHGQKVLMVGRMRPRDRDELIRKWGPHLRATENRCDHDDPIFVVATQCLEVGANLDFDAMVTECASLDALRQRFGRLNRLGGDHGRGAIVVSGADLQKNQVDFVYGTALRETWEWLNQVAAPPAAGQDHPIIDFGIEAFDSVWRDALAGDPDMRERLSPPAPSAPVMLPAHLDLWAQTAPVPAPDPDPSIFLHGPERGAPEVQVCWRADLEIPEKEFPDWKTLRALWANTVALVPPTSAECMPVPLHVVVRWLRNERRPDAELADVEGSTAQGGVDEDQERDGVHRMVLRWRGPEDSEIADGGAPPRPGDTVVIPAGYHGWEVFGHIPAREDASGLVDIGDAEYRKRRRRSVLRLHPRLMEGYPAGPVKEALQLLALRDQATVDVSTLGEEAGEVLADLNLDTQDLDAGDLKTILEDLRHFGFDTVPHPSGVGWVLRGKAQPRDDSPAQRTGRILAVDTFTTDDDSASAAERAQPLDEHCRGVAELAAAFARGCGVPEALAQDLRLAGMLHDLGKADPRFQAWLQGGSSLAAQLAPRPLAKSRRMPEDRRERERARRRAGYPEGARHELVSVRLAESHDEALGGAHDPDLVLHLIASHHGHCRPFAPVIADEEPVEVRIDHDGRALACSSDTALERIDSGIAERFWRLVHRYGWWGLAYLEGIFRLADHRRSEVESQQANHRKQEGEASRRRSA